jgi:hypothetical protein
VAEHDSAPETTWEKILDFVGEHPILTVVIIIVTLDGIADIVKAFLHH